MTKKVRAVAVVAKIKKILKLVKADTHDNKEILGMLAYRGEGKHSLLRNKDQIVEKTPLEGATAQKRANEFSAGPKVVENKTKINSAGETHANKKTQDTKKTETNGCPVTMDTGEEIIQIQDFTLPGHLSFTFERIYRSSAAEVDVGLGPGWSHPLLQSLIFDNGEVHWYDAQNKKTVFPEPTANTPSIENPLAASAISLAQTPGHYLLAQAGSPNCIFERFGNFARLKSFIDVYGNKLNVQYDNTGHPTAITNPVGLGLFLVYHNEHISQIELRKKHQTAEGIEWITEKVCQRFIYNEQNQLIANLNPLAEGEQYEYDDNNLIQLRKMAGGAEFRWLWQGEGKHARALKHWSNTGFEASYEWDDENNSVTVQYPDGSSECYQHNQDAKLLFKQDPDGATTHYEYNEDGQLTHVIDALGNETQHQYDLNGKPAATFYPDGQIVQYQYFFSQLREIKQGKAKWQFDHNDLGDVIWQKDPLGHITRYHYNRFGQLDQVRYQDDTCVELGWNHFGQLIRETLPDGGQIQYRYDLLGRQILRQDANGAITHFEWDDADRLTKIILPNQASRSYQYNAHGKVTLEVDEQGNQTQYEYHPNLHLVSKRTNPDGSTLTYRYDNPKRFVSDIINEKGEQYQIQYFANGLVKQEIGFDGITTQYQYDLLGNLTFKRQIGLAGTQLDTLFERDVMGWLVKKTLPDGQEIEYHYDTQGNLISVDDGERPLHWQYDLNGQLIAEHQSWASQYYDYDPLGRVKRWQLPDGQQVDYEFQQGQLAGINLNGEVLTQHLFRHGQEVKRSQGALTSEYQYDEQGRLTQHAQLQQLLQMGASATIKQQRQYQYDVAGNLTQVTDSLKGDRQYHYDPLARLSHVRGNIDEHFQHDPAGHLLSQTLGKSSSAAPASAQVKHNRLAFQGDCHFEYDEFGNLVKEKRGKGQQLV
ncbi:DUF6531 domain-containing protein, partial [Motilimonas sp. 1_MG-2023]|uniref:DUF6531 domain-containing protein n=1 Tax=Motilimonas sp. 1_MG-2023 TaxID=3062672 RepID=UPI0026E13AD3